MVEMMQAVTLRGFGGSDVLEVAEIPRPQLRPTEVLVRLHAAGVNPVDWKTRSGSGMSWALDQPPRIVGWDVAGEVVGVGFGVTRFAVGDRVFGMPHFPRQAGAYAQYVAAPSRHFAHTPPALTDVQAAALPLAALTAWQALVDTAAVTAGQTVLLLGAAGGVGHLAVQIAKARGARVVGTARAAKHDLLRELGADELVDHSTTAVEDVVRDIDVALDLVGGDTGLAALPTLAPHGLLIGVPGGVSEQLAAAAAAAGRRVTGILVEPDARGMEAIADLVTTGRLRPIVAQTFPLVEAAKAHDLGEQGHVTGKLVLTVD